MDGLFPLLSLSAVMATASFLVGLLPLSFSMSQSRLRLIATLGVGVLVGTSLTVIIPEGVDTLYSSEITSHRALGRASGPGDIHRRWATSGHSWLETRESEDVDAFMAPGPVMGMESKMPPATPTEPGVVGALDTDSGKTRNNQSTRRRWRKTLKTPNRSMPG